jgi:hypothetical protein
MLISHTRILPSISRTTSIQSPVGVRIRDAILVFNVL